MVEFSRQMLKSFSGNIRRGLCYTEEIWRMTEQLPLKALIPLFAFVKFRCQFWVSALSAKPQYFETGDAAS
jgi:hypothetical protein